MMDSTSPTTPPESETLAVDGATEAGPAAAGGAPAADTQPSSTPTQLSREQILRVTAESLLRQGYDKTTIRQIASMLQCAVGSIYRYFPDKRALLAAVTQQILEPVAELVTADGERPAEADVLDQSVALYVQRATAAPEVYRLMFWLASVGQTDAASQSLPDVINRIIEGWAGLIGSRSRARRQWALVHGGLMLGLEEADVAAFAAHLPAARASHGVDDGRSLARGLEPARAEALARESAVAPGAEG